MARQDEDDWPAAFDRAAYGFVSPIFNPAREQAWVADVGADSKEFPTKREAVQYLRLWRLMNGLNEDGTRFTPGV